MRAFRLALAFNHILNPMNRLPPFSESSLPADQQRFFNAVSAIRRRPISGPFLVLMHSSPELCARYAHLGHYFHSRGQADESLIPLRVRAFISLIGSRALDAPYEWAAWVNWALEAGVHPDTAEAIRENQPLLMLNEEESLICCACQQLMSNDHQLSQEIFDALIARFGPQGVVELVLTLGYFTMIALPLNAFESEITDAQKKLRKSFSPLIVPPARSIERSVTASLKPLSDPILQTTARLTLLTNHQDLKGGDQHFLDRIVLTRGFISPAFALLLHSPDMAARIAHIGEFFLFESPIPSAIHHLIGLLAARELDCTYTWQAHLAGAKASTLSPETIDALECGKPLNRLCPSEQLATDYCYHLLRGNHHVSAQLYEKLLKQFGKSVCIQIAATLGYYVMMSLLANAFTLAPPSNPSLVDL